MADISLPLPIVDLTEDAKSATSKVREACTEHGFFFELLHGANYYCWCLAVSNHGIPDEVIAEQYKQSAEFFNLPETIKLKYQAIGNRGYTGLHEQTLDPVNQTKPDTKESYYISFPEAKAGSEEAKLPYHQENQWPAENPKFKPAMLNYVNCMDAVWRQLVNLITAALDLPDGYFDASFKDPIITMRPIHYTAEVSDSGSGIFGAGAHTDWGFLTLVETNNTPGLELCYKGNWYAVPSMPGTFVVNIGDLLQTWSNGIFRSTLHRVSNYTPEKERNSCAFFLSPDYDTEVECLPSCVGDGAKFPPVKCFEYLNSKYSSTHSKFTQPHK